MKAEQTLQSESNILPKKKKKKVLHSAAGLMDSIVNIIVILFQ